MRWHLFQGTLPFDDRAPLSPTPGLFATIHTQPVFIIGTYSRYGVRMADVLRLKPHSGRREFMAYLSSVKTVPQAELQGVGPHFRLANRKRVQVRRSLVFEPTSADDIRIAADAEYARRMAGAVNARTTLPHASDRVPALKSVPTVVFSRAMEDHCARMAAQGEVSRTKVRAPATCSTLIAVGRWFYRPPCARRAR